MHILKSRLDNKFGPNGFILIIFCFLICLLTTCKARVHPGSNLRADILCTNDCEEYEQNLSLWEEYSEENSSLIGADYKVSELAEEDVDLEEGATAFALADQGDDKEDPGLNDLKTSQAKLEDLGKKLEDLQQRLTGAEKTAESCREGIGSRYCLLSGDQKNNVCQCSVAWQVLVPGKPADDKDQVTQAYTMATKKSDIKNIEYQFLHRLDIEKQTCDEAMLTWRAECDKYAINKLRLPQEAYSCGYSMKGQQGMKPCTCRTVAAVGDEETKKAKKAKQTMRCQQRWRLVGSDGLEENVSIGATYALVNFMGNIGTKAADFACQNIESRWEQDCKKAEKVENEFKASNDTVKDWKCAGKIYVNQSDPGDQIAEPTDKRALEQCSCTMDYPLYDEQQVYNKLRAEHTKLKRIKNDNKDWTPATSSRLRDTAFDLNRIRVRYFLKLNSDKLTLNTEKENWLKKLAELEKIPGKTDSATEVKKNLENIETKLQKTEQNIKNITDLDKFIGRRAELESERYGKPLYLGWTE